MKIIKIHGVKDNFFDQIEKFDGIGRFIEEFIEQAHQFGMLDEKKNQRKKFSRCININK